MNKKKKIKFMSILISFCLVLSYFAALSPTTAYYYKAEAQSLNFTFSRLSVQQTVSETPVNLNLKGATKFEDFDEYLFDDVAYEQYFTVTNNADAPAKIYVNVNVSQTDIQNGLKYFVYQYPVYDSGETVPQITTAAAPTPTTKGSAKTLIETELVSFNVNFVNGITEENAYTILNNYNNLARTYLSAPLLQSGDTVRYRIIFWAQYGMIETAISDTSSITTYNYTANVTVKATQDTPEAAVA